MKRDFFLSLLFLSVVLCASVLDANNCKFEDKRIQVNAGPIFNYAQYNLGNLSKIDGYLAGIHVDVQHSTPSRWYGRVDFDGRWEAGFICGEQDVKSHIHDYRTQGFFGYSIFKTNCLNLAPFTGLGFYHLSKER